MEVKTVLPGSTIGLLGGGQLARMITIEAKTMGYDVICMDPQPNSPCGQVADGQIVAPLDDLEAACRLAEQADVLLYEFENMSPVVAEELEQNYYLPQQSNILKICQNRLLEKRRLLNAGFPVTPFRVVRNYQDLIEGVLDFGYPSILKTVSGRYDGRGQ